MNGKTKHCLVAAAALLAACSTEEQTTATSADHSRPAAGAPTYSHLSPAEMAILNGPGPAYRDEGRDRYPEFADNPVRLVTEDPVSTFSVDVDTASYAIVRRHLTEGILPPADAVRIEELVNYFDYSYEAPDSLEEPFRADLALFDAPWGEGRQLLRIGLKGYDIPAGTRPAANIVFLIDTSGSMQAPDKLPLVKRSLRILAQAMDEDDRIAIVAYAGAAGVVLEPTRAAEMGRILDAVDRLQAGGSTAGGAGLQLAYRLAERNFREGAVNRVILATDGDFNVGVSNPDALENLIAAKRRTGIYLSVLGFGRGNLHDRLMQRIAQAGNGNAAYIDSLMEARKVLVEEMTSTLFPIADDVKVQIEFNPAHVAEYRLIGYETRMLRREDFRNDSVDAGEVGSGHAVTALYELVAPDSDFRRVDDLRYGDATPAPDDTDGELAWLRIRYKLPGEGESRVAEIPVMAGSRTTFDDAPADARFAAAVAGFGQLLRDSGELDGFGFEEAARIAERARGGDPSGYRAEFARLVRTASELRLLASK